MIVSQLLTYSCLTSKAITSPGLGRSPQMTYVLMTPSVLPRFLTMDSCHFHLYYYLSQENYTFQHGRHCIFGVSNPPHYDLNI
jgi:hypothetical protein